MKTLTLTLALLCTSTLSTLAFGAEPLLVKSNFPGFTHPDWSRFETCSIYTDRVVIERRFGAASDGSFTATETRKVALSSGIHQVTQNAAAETLDETPNYLCDGPSTSVVATLGTADTSDDLMLFTTGACGSPRKERTGVYTKMLRDLIDNYCAKTYDNGRGDN